MKLSVKKLILLLSLSGITHPMEFTMSDVAHSTPLKKEAATAGALWFCGSTLVTHIEHYLDLRHIRVETAFRRAWLGALLTPCLYIFLSPESQALRAQKKIKNAALNPLMQSIKKTDMKDHGKWIDIAIDWEKILKTTAFCANDTLSTLSSDLKTSATFLSNAQSYWFAPRSTEFVERAKKLSEENDTTSRILEAAIIHLKKSPQWKQEIQKL